MTPVFQPVASVPPTRRPQTEQQSLLLPSPVLDPPIGGGSGQMDPSGEEQLPDLQASYEEVICSNTLNVKNN